MGDLITRHFKESSLKKVYRSLKQIPSTSDARIWDNTRGKDETGIWNATPGATDTRIWDGTPGMGEHKNQAEPYGESRENRRGEPCVRPTPWNNLLNPILKKNINSFMNTGFRDNTFPTTVFRGFKTLNTILRHNILNIDNQAMEQTSSKHLSSWGKTGQPNYIINQMKKIIIDTDNHQQTENKMDSVVNKFQESHRNQQEVMTHIADQMTHMNRKIDGLQNLQTQQRTLMNANKNAKDGGFYDY